METVTLIPSLYTHYTYQKGSSYTITGERVSIDPDGEEYWEYQYDFLDRLIGVKKNGVTVAEYTYNATGLRVKKENSLEETYYLYNQSDQLIYEQENILLEWTRTE